MFYFQKSSPLLIKECFGLFFFLKKWHGLIFFKTVIKQALHILNYSCGSLIFSVFQALLFRVSTKRCHNTITILSIIRLLLLNHLLKKKIEVLLRKFADDAQIGRTINNIYISENSVSCCTALRAHILSVWSLSTNFSVGGFHSPPTCKSDIGFLFPGVWPSPFMCVQTHCLNEFPFLPNNPAVCNWLFLNTVYHSTKLCIICKLY